MRALFELGEVPWQRDTDWPDYLSLGLEPRHASELAAVLRDPRFGVGPDEFKDAEPTEQQLTWGWSEVHVPRALALLGGPEAAPALLAAADRCLEEGAFGDVLTDELNDWLERLGREGAEHCASAAGRVGNSWLVESAALDTVAAWVRGHPGPEADAMKAAVVDRLTASLGIDVEEDASTLGNRVYQLAEWRVTEALPVIEAAFAAGRVDSFASGSIDDVRLRMEGRELPEPRFDSSGGFSSSLGSAGSGPAATRRTARREKKKRRKRRKGR